MSPMANRVTRGYRSGVLLQDARHGEPEGRDRCIEPFAFVRDHLVAALHGTDRGFDHGAARIAEALAWFEMGLLADDAVAAHFLHLAVRIRDDPVAGQELRGHAALVAQR